MPLAVTSFVNSRRESRIVTADQAAALKGEAAAGFPTDAGATATSQSGSRAWVASENVDLPRGPTLLRVEAGGRNVPCTGDACREPIAGLWWSGPDTLLILRGGNADNGGRSAIYRWRPGVEPGPRPQAAKIPGDVTSRVGRLCKARRLCHRLGGDRLDCRPAHAELPGDQIARRLQRRVGRLREAPGGGPCQRLPP